MQCEGTVVKKNKDMLTVRVKRGSACGESCAACKIGCPGIEQTIEARDAVGADEGDTVVLELKSRKVIGAAFLVYILPLILLVCGYYIAHNFSKSDVICAIAGFIFMIIGFVFLHAYDRRVRGKYSPEAVSLIEKTETDGE